MPATMACTIFLGDAVADTSAATPRLKNPTATFTHTPPATGAIVVADNTNKNTGRTQSATQAFLSGMKVNK